MAAETETILKRIVDLHFEFSPHGDKGVMPIPTYTCFNALLDCLTRKLK
jgi:hypothetical protein